MSQVRRFVSEMIGSCFYMYVSCGCYSLAASSEGKISEIEALLFYSLSNGIAFSVMTYSVQLISGAHLFPIITWSLFISKKTRWNVALLYILAQLSGSLLGVFLLRISLP